MSVVVLNSCKEEGSAVAGDTSLERLPLDGEEAVRELSLASLCLLHFSFLDFSHFISCSFLI
jgi:hypothetical protein